MYRKTDVSCNELNGKYYTNLAMITKDRLYKMAKKSKQQIRSDKIDKFLSEEQEPTTE